MSETLEVRAEILKLARLIDRAPPELAYMERLPAADIRQFREQVTDALFTAHRNTLSRLAAASKLLPVALAATIGERAFGALLSARLAAMLEPSRAVEMAAKLPVAFLADIAVEIDPRRANEVIGQIPPRQIAEITGELVRREEYVTMGRFVGHLSGESISAAVEQLDDRSLLQVAFVLESKESLPELIALLANDRLDAMIEVAANENLWPEALDLLNNLTDEQRIDFADRTARSDDAVLRSLLSAARELNLWDSVASLVELLSPESRERVDRAIERLELDEATRARIAAYDRSADTNSPGK